MSVRTKQLGSHWMDFNEIWYLGIFQKTCREISGSVITVEKAQVSLKSGKNNSYFT